MVKKKGLTPTQTRKYQRYKNLWGIGEATALAGAKGDKFALSLIRKRKTTKAYKKYH